MDSTPPTWFARLMRLFAFAAAAPAGAAECHHGNGEGAGAAEFPAWTCRPISQELGLLDLVVHSMPAEGGGFEVAFDDGGAPSDHDRVVLRRCSGADAPGWKARLMRAPAPGREGTVSFWLRETVDAQAEWKGPFSASMRPEPLESPPAWALGAVWYQVFPERFANGNPRNDPRGLEVHAREWRSAWARVEPSEVDSAMARAEGQPSRFRFDPQHPGGVLYNVATARRYGGDLEGLCSRLDHLKDLGVTAIYLNPIFDAPSMHKYDAADYRHVDPTLAGDDPTERPAGETLDPATWRWTSADRYLLEKVLPAARARGMRVVLDGVWNHTSTQFWAFRDIVAHGKDSAYADWYDVRFEKGKLTGWRGWNGWNGGLPQFARGADGNIVAPVRAHIADVTRRWMDPNGDGDPSDGIEGWRLDVAPDIPTSFWREWCPLVRSINPAAAMMGETWFIDRERVGGGLFDAQMNYPFAMAAVKWLDGRDGFGSRELREALDAAADRPAAINLAQMNLLDSHDTARVATMLNNPGRGYGGKEKIGKDAKEYETRRPDQEVYERVVLGVALQATWPGSPMVFGGDEWGVFGADDPDCRKPVPWPELGPYEDALEGPQEWLRDQYRTWLTLRQDPVVGQVLRYGDVEWVQGTSPDVAAFVRTLNSIRVLIVLNRSTEGVDAATLGPEFQDTGVVKPRSANWWRLPDGPAGR